MTIFEITTVILLPIALSMGYAFKKHNEKLLEQEREEQKNYYQYVKENWMYLKGSDDEWINADFTTKTNQTVQF